MSEDDSEHGASFPTAAPRYTSPRVRFSPPRFDSTSSSSFSAFSRTWLAYIRVTEPLVSKQLDMLLLCVDDRARQYYYEVDRPEDSMNNALELLRARFEGERNALAECVSLAKTVQQPGKSLVEYGSSIRKNARHCAYPAGYTDKAMRDVFVAGVSSESVRQAICRAFGVATKAGQDFLLESAIEAACMEQQALDIALSLLFSSCENRICCYCCHIRYRWKLPFQFISSCSHL